jgi:RecB family exonuclease
VPSPAGSGQGQAVSQSEIRLTGSQLDALLTCPRRWFLLQRGRAAPAAAPAARFGSLVHCLVQRLAAGLVSRDEAEAALDQAWPQLGFAAPWQSVAEREAASRALDGFELWRQARVGYRLLATEAAFDLPLTVGRWRVRLIGQVDWLDCDGQGRCHLVDFKTARRAVSAVEAAGHRQLGVYQLAVNAGGLTDQAGRLIQLDRLVPPDRSIEPDRPPPTDRAGASRPPPKDRPAGQVDLAGAELVYLRLPAAAAVKTLLQPSLSDQPWLASEPIYPGLNRAEAARLGVQRDYPSWVHHALAAAAAIVTAGRFPATVQPGCRSCAFRWDCPTHTSGDD